VSTGKSKARDNAVTSIALAQTRCTGAWPVERLDRVLDDAIDVAPAPRLARLAGADHGVRRRMEVARGVLVLRIVAAADVAARQAHPQVDPRVARFQAFLAAVGVAGARSVDLMKVRAVPGHAVLLV